MTWQIAAFILYFIGAGSTTMSILDDYPHFYWEVEDEYRKLITSINMPKWVPVLSMCSLAILWPIALLVEILCFSFGRISR